MASAQTSATAPLATYSESKPYEPRILPTPAKPKKEKKPKQEDKAKTASPELPPTVIAEPKPLSIVVSVFNDAGKLVTGLQPPDFKVFIDDREQPIASVEVRRESISFVLVLDMSPSTFKRIKEMQEYALDLVKQLQPDDKVMVVSFNEKMSVLIDLTSDRAIIEKAISTAKPGDGTSLYDTVDEMFSKQIPSITGRKAVIIFTDGVDTTSRRSTYENSLTEAEKGDAAVYSVYWNTFNDMPRGLPRDIDPIIAMALARSKPGPVAEDEIGRWYLNDLINLSGGRAIPYENIKKGNVGLSVEIPQELHDQYILTLAPSSVETAGQRRKIRVRVIRPNLFLLARGSYIR